MSKYIVVIVMIVVIFLCIGVAGSAVMEVEGTDEEQVARAEADTERAIADQLEAMAAKVEAEGDKVESEAFAESMKAIANEAARALRLQGRLLSWMIFQQSCVLIAIFVIVIALVIVFLLPRIRVWLRMRRISYE